MGEQAEDRMTKQVWTYTKLAELATAMARSNPMEFDQLRTSKGSSQLVPGCNVVWRAGARRSAFHFQVPRKEKSRNGEIVDSHWLLATVLGNKRDGRTYSGYHLHITSKHFRKREVDRLLPISLPQGMKSQSWTSCSIYRADGSVAKEAFWAGGGRGQDGRLCNTSWRPESLAYDDSTGEPVPQELIASLKLFSPYQNAYYDLGWHKERCSTTREWADSILTIPGIDRRATLGTALRACKVATDLTAEHPAIGMMLFPARKTNGMGRTLPDGSTDDSVQVEAGLDGQWYLPKVLVYWLDFREQGDGESHWTTVSMTIPPHGHEGMNPMGGSSPLCVGHVNGQGARQAYHDMVCWKLGSRAAQTKAMSHPICGHRVDFGEEPGAYKHLSESLVFWPDNRDKVLLCCETADSKPVLERRKLYAATPHEVKNLIESKFVIDSLPML
jgi:hypothetical protein